MSEYTTIFCDGLELPRKVKYHVSINDGAVRPCISAKHVSVFLKNNEVDFSEHDVYNYCDPNRPKKKLQRRLPDNVKIIALKNRIDSSDE